MNKTEAIRFVRERLIEALRNGKSEPFYMDSVPLRPALNYWCTEYCIKEPRSNYLPTRGASYYFDPGDFLSIEGTEDHRFVIRSWYKEQVQDLKHELDKALQKIEQGYNELHPIEGWNSEYDEFME